MSAGYSEGRAFTDPSWSVVDRRILEHVADALATQAADDLRRDGWTGWADAEAVYRWLVPSWRRLTSTREADGVGFFGQLRNGGELGFPRGLEPRVADGAAAQGWLLAYLNVRFLRWPGHDRPLYANLVIVTEREATRALEADAAHGEAIARAAAMYESIRIHRLTVTDPAAATRRIRIRETLYLDYHSQPPSRRTVRSAEP